MVVDQFEFHKFDKSNDAEFFSFVHYSMLRRLWKAAHTANVLDA